MQVVTIYGEAGTVLYIPVRWIESMVVNSFGTPPCVGFRTISGQVYEQCFEDVQGARDFIEEWLGEMGASSDTVPGITESAFIRETY